MKGTIQAIKEFPKNTRISIDEVWYSVFKTADNHEMLKELKVGDSVNFDWKQNEQWKNISKIEKTDWNDAEEEKVTEKKAVEEPVSFQQGNEVKYTGSLKVKSFIYANIQDLESALNKFGSENGVRFTQTHVLPAIQEGDTLRFIAFCWHE